MAMQTEARPRPRPAAATAKTSTVRVARPPRVSSVPAFGGWEVDGKAAAAQDYSRDFTKIRAARMQRRAKALSWSSFVEAQSQSPAGGGGEEEEEKRRQWSSAATSDVDDDENDDGRERRHRRHGHRRLRSDHIDDDDDRRQPIQPGRPAPKGRSKLKGYLFGCVGGQW